MDSKKEAYFAQKLVTFRTEQQRKFGGRLREERLRLGLSLVEFARRVGVHRNTQTNYESGQREPDEAYYKTISTLGVSLTYIHNEERLEGLPSFAATLAGKIFSCANVNAYPDAMRNLFYIFGLNEVEFSQPFDDEQANKLIAAAFQKGELFFEASEAVALYARCLLPPYNADPSPRLQAELILEILQIHSEMEVGGRVLLSLRDTVRLIAENLIDRMASEARQGKI